ncbi:hypothetical protein EV426DRAFT_530982 [Tirmania nivea]|nr:hypothetical protein EV426DRAFT_530982 [Tirmania nivea]
MSKVIRSVKNVTKGYSSTQIKVRNATSNDPWGPSGTEMSEIARMTFDTNHDFFEIMDMLDRRLNDKGKNWKHVLKALKVLDYCLHEGSEHVVVWAKDNIYIIKTLREFIYIDEEGRDQGLSVRVTAKELTSLILDEERLRNERKDRKLWKSRVNPIDDYHGSGSAFNAAHQQEGRQPRRASTGNHRTRNDDEDAEYRLAIEASKYSAEEEKRRQANKTHDTDEDLEKAIKLSKEEEELRQKELERANAESLFDDITPQATQAPQQQFFQQQPQFQQGYAQGPAVDFWGNSTAQFQQSQSTGFLDNMYSQPFQQQPTGMYQQQMAQPTGYDQFQQIQPTGFDQQSAFMSQPTGFGNANPYSNPLITQPTGYLQPGINNPYANNNQQTEALKPMPTGSNNPFAQFSKPQSPTRTGAPSLGMLAQQQHQQQKPLPPSFGGFSTPATPVQTKQPENPQHAHLNSLLAAGLENGQDTFGNVGNLRIPAQHTAPGTFVNSAGQGARRMVSQPTGTNPFFPNQQTGVGLQPPANRLVPAHTGPAGMGMNGFGGGYGQQQGNNPFGGFAQQQQSQQPSSGQLIDL